MDVSKNSVIGEERTKTRVNNIYEWTTELKLNLFYI